MPPKKDDKGKGGKPGKAAKKEVDSSAYVRTAATLPEAGEVGPLVPELTGRIANIETLFPEWEVAGENWSEALAVEAVPALEFPAHVSSRVSEHKAVKAFLGLEDDATAGAAADPKGKKPPAKDAKKGGPAGGAEMEEPAADESGRALPRMFLGSADAPADMAEKGFLSQPTSSLFQRELSDEQTASRGALAALVAAAGEAAAEAATNAEDEESAARASAAATRVAEFETANAALLSSAPAGPMIDNNMCAALEIVARFAPAVLSSAAAGTASQEEAVPTAAGSMQYLWRAIYPKLPSGRPCFNPAGKYAVRLFFAGKWRKVYVTDAVPIDAEGKPVVATSANPLELWPLILSKAVYALYAAAGYKRSLPEVASATHASHFVAFAVHALTSWMPSSPWALGATMAEEERMRGMLEGMAFGGALLIPPEKIPGPVPMALEAAAAPTTHPEEGAAEAGQRISELRTKKFFKQEFQRRALERESLLTLIAERETRVASLSESLQTAFGEGFVAVFRDEGSSEAEYKALPVLGLCLTQSQEEEGGGSQQRPANLGDVRLLLSWSTAPGSPPPPPVVLTPEELGKESALDRIKRETPPLPPSTQVDMRWMSLTELAALGATFFALDTSVRTPCKAALGWHWRPSSAAAAADPKAKDAKGAKGKEAPVSSNSDPCVDAGALPPVLLRIASPAFFSPVQTDPEAQSALEDQSQAMASLQPTSSSAPLLKPISSHLSLWVAVHADLPLPSEGEGEGDAAALPSDVVVVLQEISSSSRPSEDPLVMRVELSRSQGLPIARASFHIPAERVRPTEPLLFWVRLFTTSSVYLTFGCGVEVAVGEAEAIWTGLGEGRSCIVREGEAPATAQGTEQLVFRVPLLLAPSEAADSDDADVALSFLHVSDRAVSSCLSTALVGDGPSALLVDAKTFPRIDGNLLPVSSQQPKLLLARAFPPGDVALPAFAWKLTILSRKPLVAPVAPVAVPPPNARFSGKYLPNNSLVLFRDVLAVDKNSFPLALRISTGYLAGQEEAQAAAARRAEERRRRGFLVIRRISGQGLSFSSPPAEAGTEAGAEAAAANDDSTPSSSSMNGRLRLSTTKPPSPDDDNEGSESSVTTPAFGSHSSFSFPREEGEQQHQQFRLLWDGASPLSCSVLTGSDPDPAPLAQALVSLAEWDCFTGPLVVTQRALEGDGASGFVSIEIDYEPLPQNALAEAEAAEAEAAAEAGNRVDLRDGVSLRLQAFRKSDRKVVADVRGRGLFQLYNLAIHGFLEDGEAPPAPVPAAAVDPKAKAAPKKDDKKGGKGGGASAVEGTEVVLELSVDEAAMVVPSCWRSRLPYAFNGEAATDDSSSSSSSPSGAEGEGSEGGACHSVPPVSPKFCWTVDMLAGIVNDCRSDTASLEACASLKNAWEDAQEGRAAKAAAALALFRERAKGKLAAEPSGSASDAVLELLATALEREAADFRSREEALAGVEEYKEYLDSVEAGTTPALVTAEQLEAARAERCEAQRLTEERAKAAVAALTAYGELVTAQTRLRVQALLEEASGSARRSGELWALREEYRSLANTKNEALRFVLDRTKAAIEKCVIEEDPAAAAAAAKGKKK